MVRGDIAVDKIYEDAGTLAFLDANPSAPGHTLVIPKEHKENILELNEHELCTLFRTVQKVVDMINKSLHPKGFNIGINHGLIAGARVPHLHVHVIPRFEGDGGGMIQMIVRNPPKEDLETIASKIRGSYEIPEYLKEQDREKFSEKEEAEVVEVQEDEEEKKMEEYLKEKEKELFPPKEKSSEKKEDEEEEMDVYEKMLKNMRIPK